MVQFYLTVGVKNPPRRLQTSNFTKMKTLIKSAIIAGIAILAAGGANAQSTSTYNASPSIATSNTSFSFQMFNSNLGTLTAVDLLFNSSVAGGSVSVNTLISGEDATFTNLAAFVRTSGTGLTQQNTPLCESFPEPWIAHQYSGRFHSII